MTVLYDEIMVRYNTNLCSNSQCSIFKKRINHKINQKIKKYIGVFVTINTKIYKIKSH